MGRSCPATGAISRVHSRPLRSPVTNNLFKANRSNTRCRAQIAIGWHAQGDKVKEQARAQPLRGRWARRRWGPRVAIELQDSSSRTCTTTIFARDAQRETALVA